MERRRTPQEMICSGERRVFKPEGKVEDDLERDRLPGEEPVESMAPGGSKARRETHARIRETATRRADLAHRSRLLCPDPRVCAHRIRCTSRFGSPSSGRRIRAVPPEFPAPGAGGILCVVSRDVADVDVPEPGFIAIDRACSSAATGVGGSCVSLYRD